MRGRHCGRRRALQGLLSWGDVGALRLGRAEAESPAAARPSPPTPWSGWSPPLRAGRTLLSGPECPASPRLRPSAGEQPRPPSSSPLPARQITGRFLAAESFPVFWSLPLLLFSLSFTRSRCSWALGGWSRGSSVTAGGQLGRGLPAPRGQDPEVCALRIVPLEIQLCCCVLPHGAVAEALGDASPLRQFPPYGACPLSALFHPHPHPVSQFS